MGTETKVSSSNIDYSEEYSNAEVLCVENPVGTYTQWLSRKFTPYVNGVAGVTVTEYSTNNVTFSTLVPSGTIRVGECKRNGSTNIILDCANVATGNVTFGPELLANGNMEQSAGTGNTSVTGPGWTTGYPAYPTGNYQSSGANTYGFYDAATRVAILTAGSTTGVNPIGGGKAFSANIGPVLTTPIILWSNIFLENGKTYRAQMDVGALLTQDVSIRYLVDGVTNVANVPVASIPINTWAKVNTFFTWAGTTGYHTFGLFSNSGAGGGNDMVGDNFSLRSSSTANIETLTSVAYSDVVKSVIDQVVETVGCNDERRDAALGIISQNSIETDIVYNLPSIICVLNGIVKTQWFIREYYTVNNTTGLKTSTIIEYSQTGGVGTWSTTVPTGTITAGSCSNLNVTTTPTTVNVTPTLLSTSLAASTAAGLYEVSFSNVGLANATVAGAVLPPGASVTYRTYYDYVTNQVKRLAAIAYSGVGTTLLISTIP